MTRLDKQLMGVAEFEVASQPIVVWIFLKMIINLRLIPMFDVTVTGPTYDI